MPNVTYARKSFSSEKAGIVANINRIVATYQAQGYRLTLRQVFYRFVAEDLFPDRWIDPDTGSKNSQKNYKKLGDILGDARMAGLVDWTAIEDRTRELCGVAHWTSPADIINASYQSYRLDKWDTQPYRLEVWIEKDALEGIAKQAANNQDVSAFSCRGYGSLSSLWEAAQRLYGYVKRGQRPVIIHLGDHDPSGIDMTRDIDDRLNNFLETDWMRERMKVKGKTTRGTIWADMEGHFRDTHGKADAALVDQPLKHPDGGHYGKPIQIRRVALNMDQIEKYAPPPNPAKTTDSRFKSYEERFGNESWELDALEPSVLDALITETIEKYRELEAYTLRQETEEADRNNLLTASAHWDGSVVPLLMELNGKKAK